MFKIKLFISLMLVSLCMVSALPTCVKVTGKSSFCPSLPDKICTFASNGPIDASVSFSESTYRSVFNSWNGTRDCPLDSTKHYISQREFCHFNQPCESDADCLPYCYSYCSNCFDSKICNAYVRAGNYADIRTTSCYTPGTAPDPKKTDAPKTSTAATTTATSEEPKTSTTAKTEAPKTSTAAATTTATTTGSTSTPTASATTGGKSNTTTTTSSTTGGKTTSSTKPTPTPTKKNSTGLISPTVPIYSDETPESDQSDSSDSSTMTVPLVFISTLLLTLSILF